MKVVLFCQSFLSCWNNGHAHFLRGIARELMRLGHDVHVYEPEDGWSRMNATKDSGTPVLEEAAALVPGVTIHVYRESELDVDRVTDGAALLIAQEWNTPALIASLGRHRAAGGDYTLLFHDNHHRSITAPAELQKFDLDGYDGVLAFGESIRHAYLKQGWARRAFTWHEAADTALFRPLPGHPKEIDLIWIGNWGDEERTRELGTFLFRPAGDLGLRARVHGVRYPQAAREVLAVHGIEYAGWLPNHRAPKAYAQARATVHIPRRPYVEALPGIPTIRVFEALACGIPLICSPWRDEEGLFPKDTYLTARDGAEMSKALSRVVEDESVARDLSARGVRAIAARHTCAHRVRELLCIVERLRGNAIASAERAGAPPISRGAL